MRQIAQEPLAVGRLVIEPSRLLPVCGRGLEAQPGLDDLDLRGDLPECDFRRLWQMLELASGRVVFPEQSGRVYHRTHRRFDVGLQRLHAGGADLADDQVPVAIQHQPRQRVRFAEHEPIIRLPIQPLTQGERHLQSMRDEGAAHGMRGILFEDARADQRMRIDVSVTKKSVAVRPQLCQCAGSKRGQGRAVGVDLIAEHPQMPRSETALLATLQAQDG